MPSIFFSLGEFVSLTFEMPNVAIAKVLSLPQFNMWLTVSKDIGLIPVGAYSCHFVQSTDDKYQRSSQTISVLRD